MAQNYLHINQLIMTIIKAGNDIRHPGVLAVLYYLVFW